VRAGGPIWHLWRRDINGSPVQLTFSEGGDIPAPRSVRWAPDGKAILFLRAGQIQLIPADGREPKTRTPPAPPPNVAAGWYARLFPRPRSANERGTRARSAARRCLRVRGELQAAATV